MSQPKEILETKEPVAAGGESRRFTPLRSYMKPARALARDVGPTPALSRLEPITRLQT